MQKKAAVTGQDFFNHINRDYRQVHQGSWAQIKDYIDSAFTTVEEDTISDEMTRDNTWRTFDCNGRTGSGYTNQRFVILSVFLEVTGAGDDAWIYFNRYNVVAGWRNYLRAFGSIYEVTPTAAPNYQSMELKMPLNAGRFNYKANAVGSWTVKIVGYDR